MTASSAIIAGKKVKRNQLREIDIARKEFRTLVADLVMGMNTSAMFEPENNTPVSGLRKPFDAAYGFCVKYGKIAFEHEFNLETVHGIKFTYDVANGVVNIDFKQTLSGFEANYTLVVRNRLAPYSTEWTRLLTANGGNGAHEETLYGLV